MNPILEELWHIKDDLAREAEGDMHRLCENTRRWAAAHPHAGPVVQEAAELRACPVTRSSADFIWLRRVRRGWTGQSLRCKHSHPGGWDFATAPGSGRFTGCGKSFPKHAWMFMPVGVSFQASKEENRESQAVRKLGLS